MRSGIDESELARKVAQLDRAREKALGRLADLTDSGGMAEIWYRINSRRLVSSMLAIQPGVVDDLPALLSSLAVEIAWPGLSDATSLVAQAKQPAPPEQAVAVWARVWQVHEQADLRLLLWWDRQGQVRGAADLRSRDGTVRPLLDTDALIAMLDRAACQPQTSASPHGLLLSGNRAMQMGDFAAARDFYTRAQHDLPLHCELRHNLALALAHLGEWDMASEEMRQALELSKQDPVLKAEYLALETDAGIAAVQGQDFSRAADHFLRILRLQADEPTALANLGNLRLREGRIPEARAIFLRFLRFHPDHPAAEKIRLALAEIDNEASPQDD